VITQVSMEVAMPTAKVITLNVCEWFEIENGKIVSFHVYFDTAKFVAEMQ
jgi:limonene-1,2-epoxide hydrolase